MRRLAIAAVAAGGITWLAWPAVARWQERRFADQLAAHAAAAPSTAAELVRELRTLGLVAVEPLMELAAAPDALVATPARAALSDQLTAYAIEFDSLGDRALLAQRLVALSDAVAAHAAEFDASSRPWASRFAQQIVAHTEPLDAASAWQVLAACEAVWAVDASATTRSPRVAATAKGPAAISFPQRVAPLPPPAAAVLSPVPPAVVTDSAADASADTSPPSALAVIMPPTLPEAKPLPSANPLRSNAIAVPTGPTAPANQAPAVNDSPGVSDSAVIEVPSPLEQRQRAQRLRTLSDGDLIAISESAERFEAAAALRVLKMRGYSEQLLEMTREIRQLPAAERRGALERAGTLPAADARRLLRWFVADADADVRLHALTLLSTTGDPRLAEIARERVVDDADPRVAELGAKLLKQ